MKICSVVILVGLVISFALPILAQEKEEAFAEDLCAIGGRSVTANPGYPLQGGGYLICVYTRVRDTWKIRVEVDKYMTGP